MTVLLMVCGDGFGGVMVAAFAALAVVRVVLVMVLGDRGGAGAGVVCGGLDGVWADLDGESVRGGVGVRAVVVGGCGGGGLGAGVVDG